MTGHTAPLPARGRGRPAIGDRIEVRLTADVLDALDTEATEHGLTRAAMLRWIIAERYFPLAP